MKRSRLALAERNAMAAGMNRRTNPVKLATPPKVAGAKIKKRSKFADALALAQARKLAKREAKRNAKMLATGAAAAATEITGQAVSPIQIDQAASSAFDYSGGGGGGAAPISADPGVGVEPAGGNPVKEAAADAAGDEAKPGVPLLPIVLAALALFS